MKEYNISWYKQGLVGIRMVVFLIYWSRSIDIGIEEYLLVKLVIDRFVVTLSILVLC